METTFDHTFRADLMKSGIFRYEQDANECSKMLQRSNFLDRTTSKALPDTSTIITRSIVERSKIAVTKKIALTALPSVSKLTHYLLSQNLFLFEGIIKIIGHNDT